MKPYDTIQNEKEKASDAIQKALQEFADATGCVPKNVYFDAVDIRAHGDTTANCVSIQSVVIEGKF